MGQISHLSVVNVFLYLSLIYFMMHSLVCFLIYVPNMSLVAVQRSAAPTFLSQGRGKSLTSNAVLLDVSSQA